MNYSIARNLHSDFNIFEQNKMPARSYFVPFSSSEKIVDTDYKNERYLSDRVMLLSGEWDFAYFEKLSQIPKSVDTQDMKFDKVTVPSTWQRTGYDQIAYINTRYPFPKKPPHIPQDVAVGIYRKCFNIDSKADRSVLTFLGVAGALCVYVNGEYVGYSEGSHNTAEFDATKYLNDGDNEILAVVYKWSNGTYLECQDMFRENGIFRDVYIIFDKEDYINDFILRPTKNAASSYNLKMSFDGAFSDGCKINVTAVDKDKNELFKQELDGKMTAELKSLSVLEWSAEIPNIYEVMISLEKDGEIIESIRTYLGFKNIKIDGEVFKFNSQPIKIKGVNHHDSHMTKGYAMSLDDLEEDVILMKEYNCNAVRTSHYPPDPAFLFMCDIYGLYVIDEADIETHGFYSTPGTYRPGRLSNDLKWASHYLDRVKRMYERDKNHASITMWSLGNESGGYKCQDVCYDFLKKENSEVPVHYEGVNRSKRWAYDVVSRMYGSQDLMRKILNGKAGDKYKGKPFFQCEYAHAMGNGPGGLEEYMQLFLASEQFLGGCIWEWADHSVYDENAKYKWTYGGDHNEPIHDGNFCVDGLFYPDRKPSSGAYEMKAVYRDIRARYLSNGKVELWNTRYFADTSDIEIMWEILVGGKVVESSVVDIVIAPNENASFVISSDALNRKDEDVYINLTYKDKSTSLEKAKEQLAVNTVKYSQKEQSKPAEIKIDGKEIKVKYNGGQAVFNKKKGLVSLKASGREMLLKAPFDKQCGFVPHMFRGKIDNDQFLMIFWQIVGLNDVKAKLTSCKVKTVDGEKLVRTSFNMVTRGIFLLAKATVDYHFSADGRITVVAKLVQICPLAVELPRFGVHCEMTDKLSNVSYYGRGELESYSDFKEHTTVGLFDTTVKEMAHKYIKPQDSGNRTEVRYAKLTDKNSNGIVIEARENLLNFNANPYTLSQLMKARHIEDLPDKNVSFVTVDGFVRGTGTNSCGPGPAKEHKISFNYFKPLSYSFDIKGV